MARNEIDSWFWNVPTIEKENQFFRGDIKWFQCGRHGLRTIAAELRRREVKSIALPSWCCETMIMPFIKNGVSVNFYPVTVDAQGNFSQNLSNIQDWAMLVMDYFGFQAGDAHVPADYHGIVVRDTTHRPFTGGYNDAKYYVGSLRKWAGFWTGGYAMGQFSIDCNAIQHNADYVEICKHAMELKEQYIDGKSDNKEEYLQQYAQSEESHDGRLVYGATQRDIDCAKHLDVDLIFDRRRKNAQILIDGLKDICVFKEIENIDCPLFVPIIVPDGRRDNLRQYLTANDIYCPVHWSISSFHNLTDEERFVYENELSLVCDQRYNTDDMQRIVDVVKEFLG